MTAKIYTRLFSQIRKRGVSSADSRRIAQSVLTARGHLKPGTLKATKAGEIRGNMGAADRAIARASKATGKPRGSFKYKRLTNSAILKTKKNKKITK